MKQQCKKYRKTGFFSVSLLHPISLLRNVSFLHFRVFYNAFYYHQRGWEIGSDVLFLSLRNKEKIGYAIKFPPIQSHFVMIFREHFSQPNSLLSHFSWMVLLTKIWRDCSCYSGNMENRAKGVHVSNKTNECLLLLCVLE